MTEPRKVEIGSSRYTEVLCTDEPGAGGACHEYCIGEAGSTKIPTFGQISFQNGPVAEAGVNGCHQEDLIAIVIDRLQHFQRGNYSCRENALAITKLEEALHWLNHRTAERVARGVEGTSQT